MREKCKTYNRKKMLVVFLACVFLLLVLSGRLVYLMLVESDYYQELADDLHERERSIKAARGKIIDASGTVLADNRTVCTISVIHSQIKDPERVIEVCVRSWSSRRRRCGPGWRNEAPLSVSAQTWRKRWGIKSVLMSWTA